MGKIGFSMQENSFLPASAVVRLISEAGFDALSPVWQPQTPPDEAVDAAVRYGLTLQSLHGPLRGLPMMWRDEPAQIAREHLAAVDACAAYGIPVLVVHSWTGLDYTFRAEELFFGHFDRLVDHALSKGVQIAFENLEGGEYLDALMERYAGCDAVGLCWDSGHERCYTPDRDVLAQYGHRLLITHLNDNLGVTDPAGQLQGTDDLHLLIGDGNTDWAVCLERLRQAKPQQILNFEFKIRPKGDRCRLDLYSQWSAEEFFAQAYCRAMPIVDGYFR